MTYAKGREEVVRSLIARYVNERPIAQIRDWFGLATLSRQVIEALEAEFSIWRKWSLPREAFAKSAVGCWIPLEDLRAFLNEMPGPSLTPTDVAQRLRAFSEEGCEEPNPDLKDACLAVYAAEKSEGTELAATIARLREFVDAEETRLIHERWDAQRREAEERRVALEQSFLAGEDCRWTPIAGSEEAYCRINGRAYRLAAKQGKTRSLFRISAIDDPTPRLIGKYQNRADATKVLSEIAYQAEPRL
jgi:hypothetical protein